MHSSVFLIIHIPMEDTYEDANKSLLIYNTTGGRFEDQIKRS